VLSWWLGNLISPPVSWSDIGRSQGFIRKAQDEEVCHAQMAFVILQLGAIIRSLMLIMLEQQLV